MQRKIFFVFLILLLINTFVCASELSLNARAAILYDRTSGRILYQKNAETILPNASTTKILTAIVAYENANIADVVDISKNAALVSGSTIGLRTGDKVTLNDLICAMLIASGNDAAVAVSEFVGGNISNFCNMMNEKAKAIGAKNSNFLTPHGLDTDEHFSTAYDLALIANYALNIPYLAEIFAKKSEVITVNGYSRTVHTTNEMLSGYAYADGVKTGYTGDAGRCLVTSATKDGWQVISVVLGCDTKAFRTSDSYKLLEYGFSNFKLIDIFSYTKKKFNIVVPKTQKSSYLAGFDDEFWFPLKENEISNIRFEYEFDLDTKKFKDISDNVGVIKVFYGKFFLDSSEIKLMENIGIKKIPDFIKDIFKNALKSIKI